MPRAITLLSFLYYPVYLILAYQVNFWLYDWVSYALLMCMLLILIIEFSRNGKKLFNEKFYNVKVALFSLTMLAFILKVGFFSSEEEYYSDDVVVISLSISTFDLMSCGANFYVLKRINAFGFSRELVVTNEACMRSIEKVVRIENGKYDLVLSNSYDTLKVKYELGE